MFLLVGILIVFVFAIIPQSTGEIIDKVFRNQIIIEYKLQQSNASNVIPSPIAQTHTILETNLKTKIQDTLMKDAHSIRAIFLVCSCILNFADFIYKSL